MERPGILLSMNLTMAFREFLAVPGDPFHQPRAPRWHPAGMRDAPPLPARAGSVRPGLALLINPFYPKDPHASFGKHVLTPTLALSSVAAATPEGWEVRVWDENLLQGAAPADPLPEVVGITVHLTFAERAYTLARWYRERGSRVILGGLHVLSCPDEAAPHADALALGEGAALWGVMLRDLAAGRLKARYAADFDGPYDGDPAPRRDLLPRGSFLTTASLIATRGCHNRCGFCYLATGGLRMPYRMREPADIRRQWEATGGTLRGVRGQQPRFTTGLSGGLVPGAPAAEAHLERGGHTGCHR